MGLGSLDWGFGRCAESGPPAFSTTAQPPHMKTKYTIHPGIADRNEGGGAWGVGPGFGWDVGDLVGIWEIGLGFGRFGCDFEDLVGI